MAGMRIPIDEFADLVADSVKAELKPKFLKGIVEHPEDIRDLSLFSLLDNANQETLDQYSFNYTTRYKLKLLAQMIEVASELNESPALNKLLGDMKELIG